MGGLISKSLLPRLQMALQSLLMQLVADQLRITPPYNIMIFLFLLFLLPILLLKKHLLAKNGNLNLLLPPSPPKLPVIGNLHQLGTLPHRSLQALSNKYGPLMLLHLGQSPTLVVSSAEMAREMMKTHHDVVFSNRPNSTAANILLYGCQDLGFAPYGDYWRHARKISVQQLLSNKRVQSFQYVRDEEVAFFINKIRRSCFNNGGSSVDLTEMIQAVINNIVSRCVLGRRTEEENGRSKFGELARRLMVQFTAFCFGDMFPCLGWIDVLTGHIGRLNATFRALDAFFDQVIEEHMISSESDNDDRDGKDFVHILLQLQKDGMLEIELSKDNIKGILMDMFVGGTDSTSTTIEWAMAELVKNPSMMKKAQEEVRNAVKNKLEIDKEDIDGMNYLKCVIKETLRLHAPAPLLVPRETSASVKFAGYDIPAKTCVFVNAWAIQRDPKQWHRPEEFIPERFEKNCVDFNGQDFEFIPFGAGRRGCPGLSFGVAAAEFVLANLLYSFDWKLPGGAVADSLDMSEVNGLTVRKKLPLQLLPTIYSP